MRVSKLERKLNADRLAAHRAAVTAAAMANQCPRCGRAVKFNRSMAGWVQCSQFGAVGFRADSTAPSCDWQGFTE